MGNCVSTIKGRKEPHKAITLAIIGLDNAGKTTLCYVLTGEQLDPDLAPTVGFRNVKFSHSNFDVTIFDLGGGENIRPIWKTYFGEVFGLMYVIDSSTPSRLSEARDMLKNTLEHPQVSGKPVLILANKVDKEEHMKETDIISALQLNTVNISTCPSKLVMVSALRGVGNKMDKEIQKGLQWLFEKIRTSLSSLEPRVQEDMKTAKESREKEREERKARVKKQREEREKAEELERTRLGLSTKQDSDEDDIIIGDPFKALDLEKLKNKEQQLKEEKLLRKKRIKELASKDEEEKDNESTDVLFSDDKSVKMIGTKQDMAMSLSEGLTLHLDETDTSAMTLLGRRSQASTLPPLEPVEYQNNLATSADRKKRRKKKKLTDYHLSHDNDLNLPHKEDVTVTRALSPHVNVLSNSTTNILGQTPMNDKPKKYKVDENAQEQRPYRDYEAKQENNITGVDRLSYSEKQMSNDVSPPFPENKKETHMKDYDTVSSSSKESKYRKSLKKINLSDVHGLDKGAKGDSLDDSDKNISKDRVIELQNIQYLNDKTSRKSDSGKKNKNSLTHPLSDEENNSYASHSILQDTLRFPLSPEYVEDLRNAHKEVNHLHKHRNSVDSLGQQQPYAGIENGGFTGFKSKSNPNTDGEHNDLGNSKSSLSRSAHSPDGDEEVAHRKIVPEKSDIQRKKKRNFLRSNKIAPLGDENLQPVSQEMPGSTHTVHRNESKPNSPVAETQSRNRYTTVTSQQGNTTLDSDFNTNWGLAEDLPAIDSSSKVYRVPNFDVSDDDDIVY